MNSITQPKRRHKRSVHTNIKGVRFELEVIRNGKAIKKVEGKNLILDSGLDKWASVRTTRLTRYLAVGTGTAPTQRDSSTTTASQSGNTVTASASFFEAADVGRLLKYDSGEEYYITGYTNATTVTVDTSNTVAASEFTVWYVDDTTLETEFTRISTFRTESGDNQSSESAGVVTHKRTHLSNAFGSAQNIRELGWTNDSSLGTLFNRVLLGSAVAVGAGDQLKVVSFFEFSQTPRTSRANTPTPNGDWTTELNGTEQIEGYGLNAVESSGGDSATSYLNTTAQGSLENDATNWDTFLWTENTAFTTYGSSSLNMGTSGTLTKKGPTRDAYSSGTYELKNRVTYAVGEGNHVIGSVGLTSANSRPTLRSIITTPPTKANDHTLEIVFANTWGRTLTN